MQELKASIAERGLQQALVYDEKGNLLDGFARERICEELGIPVQREGSSPLCLGSGKVGVHPQREHAHAASLESQEKEDLVRAYFLKDAAICDNTLADLIGGISKNTVATFVREWRQHVS